MAPAIRSTEDRVPRLVIFGATGALGSHVLRQALAAGHAVTAVVRTASRVPPELRGAVAVREADLGAPTRADIARLISGHDALINCAGHVADGRTFVDLVDGVVRAVESLPAAGRPVCWFLAGAALLDIGASGARGVDLPGVGSTYWPHRANFERLQQTELDWRLLCPGPLVEMPALGLHRLRISLDRLPIDVPEFAEELPYPEYLPILAKSIPQMMVPYADAAALMLAHLDRENAMAHRRVGLAPQGAGDPVPHRTWDASTTLVPA